MSFLSVKKQERFDIARKEYLLFSEPLEKKTKTERKTQGKNSTYGSFDPHPPSKLVFK